MSFETITYAVDGPVAVLTLNRPERANAENDQMGFELDQAWWEAADDSSVKVILLRAAGKHFSAGHDLRGNESTGPQKEAIESAYLRDQSGPRNSADQAPSDVVVDYWRERRNLFRYCLAWRDVPKPSIAAVQGKCIAAGLMFVWPCDLVVAADDAEFLDPTVRMGFGGIQFHSHTWEVGARRAKEMLFLSEPIRAKEALQLGMVNRVVPRAELDTESMVLARRIAEQDAFALLVAKRAVNQTLEAQGYLTAIQSTFDLAVTGYAAMATRGASHQTLDDMRRGVG
jgi:enoyl-CoA hydratase